MCEQNSRKMTATKNQAVTLQGVKGPLGRATVVREGMARDVTPLAAQVGPEGVGDTHRRSTRTKGTTPSPLLDMMKTQITPPARYREKGQCRSPMKLTYGKKIVISRLRRPHGPFHQR